MKGRILGNEDGARRGLRALPSSPLREFCSETLSACGYKYGDVAQVSNLLYRGFLIRNRHNAQKGCRLEVGDTAGWKPALRDRSADLIAWYIWLEFARPPL